MTLEKRVQDLIDDRLISYFWNAVEHFKTTDLVLYFDTSEPVYPVSAYSREKLIASEDAPISIRDKICKPAIDAAILLKNSPTAFWLIASFPDGEMCCAAVIAERIVGSGSA